jgi:hypothetical protein
MKPKVIAGPSVPPAPQYPWPVGDAMQLPAPNRPGIGADAGLGSREPAVPASAVLRRDRLVMDRLIFPPPPLKVSVPKAYTA